MGEFITSRQNPLMVQTVKLLTSRKQRRDDRMMAGDGMKLLKEALQWAPDQVNTVILREGVKCPELPPHVRLVTVPDHLMKRISTMDTPEGAIFLMDLPEILEGEAKPCTLVLDGVQDPGNLGTILRTADAMDVPVLLTEGCADPFSPKTIRATMGAVLRTAPRELSRETLIAQCREKKLPLLATTPSGIVQDVRKVKLKKSVVVVGSEGQGVSEMLLEAADGRIAIPMSARCESLNAASAAAILLWQMTNL